MPALRPVIGCFFVPSFTFVNSIISKVGLGAKALTKSNMAITKEKKIVILETIRDILKSAESVVFVNFHGLSHGDENTMRQSLFSNSVGYYVAKKTLIRRALGEAKIEGEVPILSGEVSLVHGSDPLAPAREVYEFTKKHKENLSILGGIFEGRFVEKAEMMSIATIPPLDILYGQVANVINSPIQGLVFALHEIAEAKN